jgi:hypothetical protein
MVELEHDRIRLPTIDARMAGEVFAQSSAILRGYDIAASPGSSD